MGTCFPYFGCVLAKGRGKAKYTKEGSWNKNSIKYINTFFEHIGRKEEDSISNDSEKSNMLRREYPFLSKYEHKGILCDGDFYFVRLLSILSLNHSFSIVCNNYLEFFEQLPDDIAFRLLDARIGFKIDIISIKDGSDEDGILTHRLGMCRGNLELKKQELYTSSGKIYGYLKSRRDALKPTTCTYTAVDVQSDLENLIRKFEREINY